MFAHEGFSLSRNMSRVSGELKHQRPRKCSANVFVMLKKVKRCFGSSKPVARHFILPNHFNYNMTVCGLPLSQGNTESRKNLEQRN